MQKDTKKMISDTFVQLLEKKPFDKITVKDIVEACEINRNTFYYYYRDIYDLLEEILKNNLDSMIELHNNGGTWFQGFVNIAELAYQHKKVLNNICSSNSYTYFESYMFKSCKYVMLDFVQSQAEDTRATEEDIDFITTFYEYALFGVITEWMRTGMKEEPKVFASQLWLVLDDIKHALRKSERRARIHERRNANNRR